MEKTVVEMCATVVTAQAQSRRMTPEEISESIRTIFGTLDALNRAACQPSEGTSMANGMPDSLAALRRQPQQSIQKDVVICLECGKSFLLLSNRHLKLHGLQPREYKRKWGIALTRPLSAKALTARRRKLAKQAGMGKALAEWRANRYQVAG